MQWPDARRCRQPGHAASPSPRLKSAVSVLIAGLLVLLGTLPSMTIAMSLRLNLPSSHTSSSSSSSSSSTSILSMLKGPVHHQRDGSSEYPRYQKRSTRDGPAVSGRPSSGVSFRHQGRLPEHWNTSLSQDGPNSPLTNQERQSRSLALSGSVLNDYWVLFDDAGKFITISKSGAINMSMTVRPADGLLRITALPAANGKLNLASLKGVRSNRFFCMHKNGTFYSTETFTRKSCAFREIHQQNHYITLCREKVRPKRKQKKNCQYFCVGYNKRKNILKRYCEGRAETFMNYLSKESNEKEKEQGPFSPGPTLPNPSSRRPKPSVPSRRRNERRHRKNRQRNKEREQKTCHLFCKDRPSTTRRNRDMNRHGRDHRRRTRRKHQRRRRQHQKRPRRARTTTEMGLFAEVT